MVLEVSLTRTTAQKDEFRPLAGREFGPSKEFWSSSEREAEVVHFKRLKGEGVAKEGSHEVPFELLLDMRGRLLSFSVSKDAPIAADRIGRTIVHGMGTFMLVPVRDFIFPRMVGASHRSEWMVADENHVSGLLHRLQEAGPISETEEPPWPDSFIPILDELFEDLVANYKAMRRVEDNLRSRTGRPHVDFRFTRWNINSDRFLRLCPDERLKREMAQFFDSAKAYAAAADILRLSPEETDRSARNLPAPAQGAQDTIQAIGHETTQLALRLTRDFATESHRKEVGWPGTPSERPLPFPHQKPR